MSRLAAATAAARKAVAITSMERYREDRLSLAKECFVTKDPKDPKQKLAKPWLTTPYHEEIWKAVCSGEYFEVDIHKSKQTFFSWQGAGLVTSGMLTIPGFRAYIQSRKFDVAKDIVDRVVYILEHLDGPLKGALLKSDWSYAENSGVLTLHSFLGKEMRCDFTALPDGAEQWRYLAASLGLMDEAAFPREAKQSHAAALSACEGGGTLIVFSTGDSGSWFNSHIIEGIQLSKKEIPDGPRLYA